MRWPTQPSHSRGGQRVFEKPTTGGCPCFLPRPVLTDTTEAHETVPLRRAPRVILPRAFLGARQTPIRDASCAAGKTRRPSVRSRRSAARPLPDCLQFHDLPVDEFDPVQSLGRQLAVNAAHGTGQRVQPAAAFRTSDARRPAPPEASGLAVAKYYFSTHNGFGYCFSWTGMIFQAIIMAAER